ncbi:MAG: hypothetical protein KGI27_12920 [Thaumarchaeota archaeon]|nr:hypothetical protein [Nitrososphaerota archaeon]
MTIEQAFKEVTGLELETARNEFTFREKTDEAYLLDPDFWRSLGRSLGWKDYNDKDRCLECGTKYTPMSGYLINWHRFIDLLAEEDK